MNSSTPESLTHITEYINNSSDVDRNDETDKEPKPITTYFLLGFIVLVIVTIFIIVSKYFCSKRSRKIPTNVHYRLVGTKEKKQLPRYESGDSGFCSMYVRPRMLNIKKREEQQVESSFSFVHFDNTLPLVPENGQLHEKSRESSRTQPLEPKILKVKPLNAAEDGDDSERQKSTGTNEGVMVNQRLDWNKLFTFLSHTIDAADSKLFFIHLFSNGEHLLPYGQTVNNKIEHISSNTKGSTPTLLFNQFEAWKSLMGDKADPKQIEKALQDRGNNEALKKFQDFMRYPPMTPVQLVQRNKMPDVLGKPCQLVLHKPNSFNKALEYTPQMHSQTMALHKVTYYGNGSQTLSQRHDANEASIELLNEQEQQTVPLNVQRKCDISQSSSRSSNFGGKRSRAESDYIASSDEDHIPCKNRRRETISYPTVKRPLCKRKKANVPNKCGELVQWEALGKTLIIELIRRLLPSDSQVLKAEEYHLFLYHTVSLLTKKTNASENTVLSVLMGDFHSAYEHKTGRGHLTFILDTENESLSLGEKEWEDLKLYAEYARSRVLRRLIKEDSDFVASKYLFIDYNGKPIIEKVDYDVQQEQYDGKKDPKNNTRKIVANNEKTDTDEKPNNCLGNSNVIEMEGDFSAQAQDILDKATVLPTELNISVNDANTLNDQTCTAETVQTSNEKDATDENITSPNLNTDKRIGMFKDKGIQTADATETDMNDLEFQNDDEIYKFQHYGQARGQDKLPDLSSEDNLMAIKAETEYDESTVKETITENLDSLIMDIGNVIEALSNENETQIINIPNQNTSDFCSFEDENKYLCPNAANKISVNNFNESAQLPRRRNSI